MSNAPSGKPAKSIGDLLREFREHRDQMKLELSKAIVGQDEVVEQLFAAIFTRGHCLLEGVPGLAKTLMVSSLAKILDVNFKRIQFTPDLMPSDITGTNVLEEDSEGDANFASSKAPSLPTSYWPTKSTVPHRKPKPHCSKRCRNEM